MPCLAFDHLTKVLVRFICLLEHSTLVAQNAGPRLCADLLTDIRARVTKTHVSNLAVGELVLTSRGLKAVEKLHGLGDHVGARAESQRFGTRTGPVVCSLPLQPPPVNQGVQKRQRHAPQDLFEATGCVLAAAFRLGDVALSGPFVVPKVGHQIRRGGVLAKLGVRRVQVDGRPSDPEDVVVALLEERDPREAHLADLEDLVVAQARARAFNKVLELAGATGAFEPVVCGAPSHCGHELPHHPSPLRLHPLRLLQNSGQKLSFVPVRGLSTTRLAYVHVR
mmetsp:Transcript_15779/g.28426  ORF Transcript_15779/g.28426 Transcript_15779/m.28426 type:complete len:280 (-) Transcript_15779:248-1087(-)